MRRKPRELRSRACVFRSASQKNRASRSRAARTRSALRAMTSGFSGCMFDDGEKRRLQLSLVVHHREEMLMVDHRRREHFLGKLQELDGKVSRDDRRILHEVWHFLEQPRVHRYAGCLGDAES